MRLDLDVQVRLIRQINGAFTPGAPIDSKDLFAGRISQVQKVLNVVFQKGTHAALFGERGVGHPGYGRHVEVFPCPHQLH